MKKYRASWLEAATSHITSSLALRSRSTSEGEEACSGHIAGELFATTAEVKLGHRLSRKLIYRRAGGIERANSELTSRQRSVFVAVERTERFDFLR